MNNRTIGICWLFAAVLSLCSCGGRGKAAATFTDAADSLSHASLLKISRNEGFIRVDIADPWNSGGILHTYLLVPSDKNMPKALPQGTVVRTPLKRAVVGTSAHCSLISSFGKLSSIAGVCDPQYINLPEITRGIANGTITDCGNGTNPTVEKIIDTDADAVLLSPFQNSGGYGKVEKIGIPIIEVADYMETSALGRAEWMKFYGMLFGEEERADSMFKEIERRYGELTAMARKANDRLSVLFDRQTGSVWYMPGGRSTIGGLLRDTNANHPFPADKHSGSIPLPFESVLEHAAHCDVWMIRYGSPRDMTLADLKADKNGYCRFKAWQTRNVYGCNTSHSTFFEDTPFNPDKLLRDFIIICHPSLTDSLGLPEYFVRMK